jgi:hypothetical protein
MSHVGVTRYRGLAVAGLLLAGLVSCGRAAPVEVTASGLPPAVPPPAAEVPTTSFQGQVASVDTDSGVVTMAVQIVWTPVLKAEPHERKVLIDGQTRWDPAPRALAALRVGEELQVEAVEAVEGVWPAVKVQLLDID